MHGTENLTGSIEIGLAVYYLLVVLLNLGYAAYWFFSARNRFQALLWTVVAVVFLIHSLAYFGHQHWVLSQGLRDSSTKLMGAMGGQLGPILYSTVSVIGFILLVRFRRFVTQPV